MWYEKLRLVLICLAGPMTLGLTMEWIFHRLRTRRAASATAESVQPAEEDVKKGGRS